jgi:hypothetical protein
MTKKTVTQEQAVSDLKQVAEHNPNVIITRNFYREQGSVSEKAWQKFFPTFDDFCAAAGINEKPAVSEIQGNSWSVFLPSTEFCTADEVIKYCKVDTAVWELERFRAKDVSKEDDPKFQISAFFKKRRNIIAITSEVEKLKYLAMSNSIPPAEEFEGTKSGNMLEVNIPDAHFGKLAWPEETGYEPYDIKIASAMYMRAVDALIERTKGVEYEQVLYVIGNDMLNADDLEGRTTSGTQVTNDARYHKVFDVARTTTIWAIERLRKIAPVRVVVVSGNHDQLSSWHLGDSVQCYFHAYKDVTVDNAPKMRKYYEWGSVLLGFTHGDKGDRADYPLLMATEQSQAFGRTMFREMHTGHLHHTKLDEKHGVRVRILPALCPADDWHSENSYVGNLRNAEAYTWNKKEGLTSIAIFNDQSQDPITSRVVLN